MLILADTAPINKSVGPRRREEKITPFANFRDSFDFQNKVGTRSDPHHSVIFLPAPFPRLEHLT